MTPEQMKDAVISAEFTLRQAGDVAKQIAYVLRGRLRHVNSPHILNDLKRELRDWDMHTCQWKNAPKEKP